jgi:hypothetical protein
MHGGAMRFGGSRFAGAHFVHAGISPRFSTLVYETIGFSAMIASIDLRSQARLPVRRRLRWLLAYSVDTGRPQWVNACGYH